MRIKEKRLSIRQNALYNSVGSLVYQACQWMITILVVRLGSVELAGVLTLAMATTSVFFTLCTFGFNTFQVSDHSGRYSTSEYVSTRLTSTTLSTLICGVYCLMLGGFNPQTGLCILIYMVFKASEAVVDVLQVIQQKADRMDFIGYSFMLRGICSLAAFVVGMVVWHSLPVALLGMTVLSFAVVLLYDWPIAGALDRFRLLWSPKRSAALLWECVPLMLNSFLTVTIQVIPKNTLEAQAGEYMMGIYGSVAAPAVIVLSGVIWLYTPFLTALTRSYSQGDRKTFMKLILQVTGILAGAFVLVLIGAALLGQWGLGILYGGEVAAYAYYLIPILLANFVTAACYFLAAMLTVARRMWVIAIANAVAVIISAAASAPAVQEWGIDGVNAVICIAMGVNALIMTVMLALAIRRRFAAAE